MQGINWIGKIGEGLLSLLYPSGKKKCRNAKKCTSKRDWKRAAKWIDEREVITRTTQGRIMRESYMKQQGYRFYVYVGPGVIEYFKTLKRAVEYQNTTGGTIGEVG